MLSKTEAHLIKMLLERYSDTLSNRGCNDFELVEEAGLTPEESYQLRLAMQTANGDVAEHPPDPNRHYTMDWWVASFLGDRVAEEYGIPKDRLKDG